MNTPVLDAWSRLLEAVGRAGVPSPSVRADVLAQLGRVAEPSAAAIALLERGWPLRSVRVARAELFPAWSDLVAEPPPGWPRALLPLGGDPSARLGLEPVQGGVLLVEPATPGQKGTAARDLAELASDVAGWLDAVPPGSEVVVGRHVGVSADAWDRLVERLGPGFGERWLFDGVQPLPELEARLEGELRLNQRVARVCMLVLLAAPVLGWFLGEALRPPEPWLGVGVALLVVGGVPGWLLAQATGRARRLRADLARVAARAPDAG